MKRCFALILLSVLPLSLLAAPTMPPQAVMHDPSGLAEPAMVLRQGIETLTGYMDRGQDKIPPAQLQQFLQREIAPYFDFEHMAWWSAGALNRYMHPGQRERLAELLQQRFIAAMVEQLSSYRHAQLVYLPPRGNLMQGDVTLGLRVVGANAPPVQLDFRLYRNQRGEWKVYDVVANGLSAVTHYRTEFAYLARLHGVPGLLQQLER